MKDSDIPHYVLPRPTAGTILETAEKIGAASIADSGKDTKYHAEWLERGAPHIKDVIYHAEWLERGDGRLPEREDKRHECYVVNVGPIGMSAGYCGDGFRRFKKPVKTEIKGWSDGSSKTLRRFLMSVRPDKLTGQGYAITFTVGKIIPKTGKEFHDALESLIHWFRYHGAIRWQWHIEWQERGAPHVHGMVYFPDDSKIDAGMILAAWLKRSSQWGTKTSGQTVKPVTRVQGWLEYQAIHSVRGCKATQRDPKSMPTGWERSGRMWGRGGDWDLQMERCDLTPSEYHTFRRFVKRYVISKTRDKNNKRALQRGKPDGEWLPSGRREIRWSRRMLRVPKTNELMSLEKKRGLAATRGLSLFLPSRVANALLAASGYREKPCHPLAANRSTYIARASPSMRFPPGWNLSSIESRRILRINYSPGTGQVSSAFSMAA